MGGDGHIIATVDWHHDSPRLQYYGQQVKVKEFVHYNQKLDQYTNEFEGAEGEETLKNFTLRLMLVVERLEKAGA